MSYKKAHVTRRSLCTAALVWGAFAVSGCGGTLEEAAPARTSPSLPEASIATAAPETRFEALARQTPVLRTEGVEVASLPARFEGVQEERVVFAMQPVIEKGKIFMQKTESKSYVPSETARLKQALAASDENLKTMKDQQRQQASELAALRQQLDRVSQNGAEQRLEQQMTSLRQQIAQMENEQRLQQRLLEERRLAMKEERDATLLQQLALQQGFEEKRRAQTEAEQNQRRALEERIATLNTELASLNEAAVRREELESLRSEVEQVFAMQDAQGKKFALAQSEISSDAVRGAQEASPHAINGMVHSTLMDEGAAQELEAGDWIRLQDYQVVVHADNQRLENMVRDVLRQARPFAGPWQLKWKLNHENSDILSERFSLNAETDFNSFANYLSSFMNNYRGFPLRFNIFEKERILLITDS